MTSLDWLPERVRAPIEVAIVAIELALGDGLIALCLIGPAVKPLHGSHSGHAELLVVAQELDHATLRTLAEGLAAPLHAGLQIRTVTQSELHGSVDVHALELAQWRDHHLLLRGRDPFAELLIAEKDLRHEIERALRSLSQRLRNRMLWCLATEQLRLDAVLREGLELLTILAHHTLALVGEQPPDDEAALLARLASWAEVPGVPILELRARLEHTRAAEDPLAELRALAAVTEATCVHVDALRL